MKPQWLLILPYQIIILFKSLLESPYNIIYQKKRKMKFLRSPLKVIKTIVRLMPRDLAMTALDTHTHPWVNILVFPRAFLFPTPGKQRQVNLYEPRPTLCPYWVSGQPELPTKNLFQKKKKGWKDSSMEKVTYCEIWWPDLIPGAHMLGETFTRMPWLVCAHSYEQRK